MPGQRAPEEERREQILGAAHRVALRSGIAGVTLRAVGAEAGVSHGLLLFHYERKDELIGALLDRVLSSTVLRERVEGALPAPSGRRTAASARLAALLRHELARLARERRDVRLFFEYWALGATDVAVRRKIGAALDRYRAALREVAADLLAEAGLDELTADSMAAVTVGLINGGLVQMLVDPHAFDVDGYVTTVQRILARAARPTGRATAAGRASGRRGAAPR